MSAVLTEFLQIMVGGLATIGQAIGGALSTLASAVFLDTTGTTPVLSTFGGILAIFAAISLGIGLSKYVVMWISSLGAKH